MVLETGGGLLKAAHFFKETNLPFLLMNVDILTDLDLHNMLKFHQQHQALATLAIRRRETSRYLLFDEKNRMVGWKNIKTNETKQIRDCSSPALFAFSGIHIIEPNFFKFITLTGKFSMIDAYLELAKTNDIIGFDHSESKMMDVGTTASLIAAEKIFP
jgi:NDP-sugar pyrophosphorylase family protein